MNIIRTRPLIFIFALLLLPFTAQATAKDQEDLNVVAQPFQQQAAQIREDIATGDKYAEIAPEDRTSVLAALTRIDTQLSAAGNVDGLSEAAKVAVFNDQELINTILTKARDDSRMLCRREVVTGSHRKQNVCLTVAERERRRVDHKDILTRHNQKHTVPLRPDWGN